MFKNEERDRWENKYIKKYGMYYSRIIFSWINVGGSRDVRIFRQWLESIKDSKTGEKVLTEDEISDICMQFGNGKLEWQADAERFIKEHK